MTHVEIWDGPLCEWCGAPLLGVDVEEWHACPQCGHEHEPRSDGTGEVQERAEPSQAGGEGSPPWGGGRGVGEPLPLGEGAGDAGQHPCLSADFGRGDGVKRGRALAGAVATPSESREGGV